MAIAISKRSILLIALTAASILAAVLLPAVPQPLEYHDFADHRTLLGIHNFFDVASNVAFLLTGALGLAIVWMRRAHFEARIESLPYLIFFLGVGLTAAGSAWYHLEPDNERLVWDRLPMTIAFMSLISAQIVERINVRLGLALLAPLLVLGFVSVFYWIVTERLGAGNVLPYVVLQAYAVFILLFFALTHPSRYSRGSDIYWVFGAYVAAKILEHFDREVLAFGQLISGHSLKHLAAAVASLVICRMLWLRARVVAGAVEDLAPTQST